MNSEHFESLVESINHLNKDELKEVVHAINDRGNYLAAISLEGFRIGDKVKWTHGVGTNFAEYTGTINKINNKTLGVKEDGRAWARWRIQGDLLTKIGDSNE